MAKSAVSRAAAFLPVLLAPSRRHGVAAHRSRVKNLSTALAMSWMRAIKYALVFLAGCGCYTFWLLAFMKPTCR
jgi:hypothetical protein